MAYTGGKAANRAPPAVSSHTSLPSHTGAMLAKARRRSSSERGTTKCKKPTPKSNPSRIA